MHYVRQQLAVHLFHLWPVGAVHIWHVKVIALVAPAFVEDLFELFSGIQIHAQADIKTSLPRLRRITIRINKEKRWRRRRSSRGWTTTAGAGICR